MRGQWCTIGVGEGIKPLRKCLEKINSSDEYLRGINFRLAVQLERERFEAGQWRPLAVDGGPAAAVGPILLGGQPGRQDRVDGELRRTVATTAGPRRPVQGRRLGRVVRLGTVHEDVRRRDGSAEPAVRQSQAEHVGPTVRGPGHGDGRLQRARVRARVGENSGRCAPAVGRPAA